MLIGNCFWLIGEQVGVWSDVGTNYGFFKTTYPISGITKHAMEFVKTLIAEIVA